MYDIWYVFSIFNTFIRTFSCMHVPAHWEHQTPTTIMSTHVKHGPGLFADIRQWVRHNSALCGLTARLLHILRAVIILLFHHHWCSCVCVWLWVVSSACSVSRYVCVERLSRSIYLTLLHSVDVPTHFQYEFAKSIHSHKHIVLQSIDSGGGGGDDGKQMRQRCNFLTFFSSIVRV